VKTNTWVIGIFAMVLIMGGPSFTFSEESDAESSQVSRRAGLRQERRSDRRDNTVKGAEDREVAREERRDCVGKGADCRSENRQGKRKDRRARTDDRKENREERLDQRI
jgi:hypothetical protein